MDTRLQQCRQIIQEIWTLSETYNVFPRFLRERLQRLLQIIDESPVWKVNSSLIFDVSDTASATGGNGELIVGVRVAHAGVRGLCPRLDSRAWWAVSFGYVGRGTVHAWLVRQEHVGIGRLREGAVNSDVLLILHTTGLDSGIITATHFIVSTIKLIFL